MTDSGFSSAASQRSTSSIVRHAVVNSSSQKSDPIAENDDRGVNSALPKPCIQYPNNLGKPGIPNRLIYEKNHGGYSPGLSPFSHQEMSPMSSLTYDFKDLSTSHGSSITPKKRLSLSSLSSLESPHLSGTSLFGYGSLTLNSHNSPHSSGISSSSSSIDPALSNSGGALSDTPTALSTECGKENQPPRGNKYPDQRKDAFLSFRKVLSLPQIQSRRPRQRGLKSDRGFSDKEREFIQSFRKTCPNVRYPTPVGFSEKFSPIGLMHGRPAKKGTQAMMSSPLVDAITRGKSSAFKPVTSGEISVKTVKRRVLGAINTNIPIPPRSPRTPENPIAETSTKRVMEESVNSVADATTRKRRCSKSLNTKGGFLQERKVRSAEAILTGKRPVPVFSSQTSIAGQRISNRSTSAPILTGDDDDDYVLSHSTLCSHDSDDEEQKSCAHGDSFSPSLYNKDDEIENMLSENMKESTACFDERYSSGTPSTLDGLISGVLILKGDASVSGVSNDTDDSISALGCGKENDPLKPRELFRSPSAPPIVPSRRALMKLKRSGRNMDLAANDSTPVSIKRPRTFASTSEESSSPEFIQDPALNRSKSYNELDIMKAVEEGCKDQDLVGDFSRKCVLPTVTGRRQDLKYISSETLAEVIMNEHDVGMVEIVDCRYTYEYEGGHIHGAHNIYTEEQLLDRYFNCSRPLYAKAKQSQTQTGDVLPHVLVFHCEFSSERAPRLARFLREYDREVNIYPSLHYPEIYLLKDGYKEFYRVMKEHCKPCSYIPMSHEGFASELRKFRIKSKTWAGEKSKQSLLSRLKKR